MSGFWTPVFLYAAKMFSVWKQLLLDLVPAGLRRYFLWSLPYEETGSRDFVNQQNLGRFSGRQARIIIDPVDSLTYSFSIPKCAGAELSRAIKLEGERILPLHVSKVVTAHRITIDESTPERFFCRIDRR